MLTKFKQKSNQIIDSLKTYATARNQYKNQKELAFFKFAPGFFMGINSSLENELGYDTKTFFYVTASLAQVGSFAGDYAVQLSYDLEKIVSKCSDISFLKNENSAHKSMEEEFKDLEKECGVRSRKERFATTASVTAAEAGIGFATGYYATELAKNIIKQYI